MTTPTPPSSTAIVNEMITKLRELQGSGEYVPLTRNVAAGAGLTGGGSLLNNVTIALNTDSLALLDKVRTSTWILSSAATTAATPSTVVMRDSSGRIKAATPSVAGDVATMGYVTTATARTVRTLPGAPELQIATGDLATHNTGTETPGVLYVLFE